MAILVALAILAGSTVAFNTPVKTCCPPGQFLAIEDWQESRQTVEGIWYSQNPAGINYRKTPPKLPPSRRPSEGLVLVLPRLAANDADRQQ